MGSQISEYPGVVICSKAARILGVDLLTVRHLVNRHVLDYEAHDGLMYVVTEGFDRAVATIEKEGLADVTFDDRAKMRR